VTFTFQVDLILPPPKNFDVLRFNGEGEMSSTYSLNICDYKKIESMYRTTLLTAVPSQYNCI